MAQCRPSAYPTPRNNRWPVSLAVLSINQSATDRRAVSVHAVSRSIRHTILLLSPCSLLSPSVLCCCVGLLSRLSCRWSRLSVDFVSCLHSHSRTDRPTSSPVLSSGITLALMLRSRRHWRLAIQLSGTLKLWDDISQISDIAACISHRKSWDQDHLVGNSMSRNIARAQWRFSMCLWAHEVWGRISREPLAIEIYRGLASKDNQ